MRTRWPTVSGDGMSDRNDPYLLPNGTLRNKLGITDQEDLAVADAEQVASRELALRGRLPGPPFTFETLKSIHRELFQDIYDWAGQPRTTPTGKREFDHPASPVQSFAPPETIEARAAAAFARLAEMDHLRGRSRAAFAAGAADLLAEVNRIHFAREGNGRAQRLLVTAVAAHAGHPVAFDIVTRERMVAVSVEAHRGDVGGMRRMLDEITDPRQVGAMRKAIGFLDAAGTVKWNDVYVSTTRAGKTYTGVLVSRAGPDFIMRAERNGAASILVGDARDLPPGVQSRAGLAFTASHFDTAPGPEAQAPAPARDAKLQAEPRPPKPPGRDLGPGM